MVHVLAVHDGCRRAGFAAHPFAIGHDQRVIGRLEQAAVPPRRRPAIDRLPRRKVVWQQRSGDPVAQHIKHRVDDLAPHLVPQAAERRGRRQMDPNHDPFLVAQIRFIA